MPAAMPTESSGSFVSRRDAGGKRSGRDAYTAENVSLARFRADAQSRRALAAPQEIDEHPETLKTCRRSAIGTRDRAIIGNRSALMDRYRGSFPLRSLLFLFYPSLQMTWKNVEEDEEEAEKEGAG